MMFFFGMVLVQKIILMTFIFYILFIMILIYLEDRCKDMRVDRRKKRD